MQEFTINKEAEIIGRALVSAIKVIPANILPEVQNILETEGLTNIKERQWYKLFPLLNIFKYISEHYGNSILFNMGKEMSAKFNLPVSDISQLIELITVSYSQTHRNGRIGEIQIINHDKANGKIIVKTTTPYPCEYDRGAFSAFSEKISRISYVELDKSKPSKRNGANESWFIIDYVV